MFNHETNLNNLFFDNEEKKKENENYLIAEEGTYPSNGKEKRNLKSWAVKLPEEVIQEIEKLYEASGLRFKNEFIEQLIQTHKVNLLKEGKLSEELIHPSIAKKMSGDLFELAKLTQMINELFVFQLEKFSQEQYEFERIKRENEELKKRLKEELNNPLKNEMKSKTNIVTEHIHRNMKEEQGNMVFLGSSGAGKSYATKLEIKNAISQGKKVIVLDPQGEYVHFTRYLGGQIIKISNSSNDKLNPMEIFINGENCKDKLEKVNPGAKAIHKKINFLCDLFKKMIYRELRTIERKTLQEAIELTYKKFGISKETASTLHLKMPTLSDLSLTLRKINETGVELAENLEPYIHGIFNDFNTERTVRLYKSSPIIVFDLHDLERELSIEGMLTCLEFIMGIVHSVDLGEVLIVIDEIWKLMQDKISKDYLMTQYINTKRDNTQFAIITQSVEDFLRNDGEGFLRNAYSISYFRITKRSAKLLREMELISEAEETYLKVAEKGEAVIHIQNENHIHFYFVYPYDEEISKQPYDDFLI